MYPLLQKLSSKSFSIVSDICMIKNIKIFCIICSKFQFYLPCLGLFPRLSSLLLLLFLLEKFLDFRSGRFLSRFETPAIFDPVELLLLPMEFLDFFDPTLLDLLWKIQKYYVKSNGGHILGGPSY